MSALRDAIEVAKVLHGSTVLPAHIRNEADLIAVILTGQEMGLGPMASIRAVQLIKGKPALDASAQLGLVKRAGIKHTWIHDGEDRKQAELKLEREGDAPHTHRFTVEDAKSAGLMGNAMWQKYTPAMLRARCVSAAVRAYCPDVFGSNAPYTAEELNAPEIEHTSTEKLALEALDGEAKKRAEEAIAADRKLHADSEATLEQWEPMIEAIEDEDKLGEWVHYHGGIMRTLHRKTKGKVWRRLLNAAERAGWRIEGSGAAKSCEQLVEAIADAPDHVEEEDIPEDVREAAKAAEEVFGEPATVSGEAAE